MKNTYVKPEMQVEEFLANSYCVNCAEDPSRKGVTINFICNAGGGKSGGVWEETNSTAGLQSNSDRRQSRTTNSFSACNKTHPVTVYGVSTIEEAIATQTDMFPGWYKRYGYSDNNAISVYVWTDGGTNTHATTLKPNEWTLQKS